MSGARLIKLGAPEGVEAVPEPVLEAYLDRYPSDLTSKGRAEADAPSAGDPPEPTAEQGTP